MTEIIISNPSEPDTLVLGIRWRKRDGLLYRTAVRVKTNGREPEELVAVIRELADKIEKEINA